MNEASGKVFFITDSGRTQVEGFDTDWLPLWAYEYVTPRRQVDGTYIELEAGPYVGAIPLQGGRVLHIAPRVGSRALAHMLLLGEGIDDFIDLDKELARIGSTDAGAGVLLHLLARSYPRALLRIEKDSKKPGRITTTARMNSIRGRPDVVATLLAHQRNEPYPAHVSFQVRTYDTPEHKVLGRAAHMLLRLNIVPDELRPACERWAKKWAREPLVEREVRAVFSNLAAGRYSGARGYYVSALGLAKLILGQADVDLRTMNLAEGQVLLANMQVVFERYIRRLVSNIASPHGLVVAKSNTDGVVRTVFLDGTGPMDPDVVVAESRSTVALVDAKYKPGGPTASDFYQMMAYLDGFECKNGVIVSPTDSSSTKLTVRASATGKQVADIRLGLSEVTSAEASLRTHLTQALGLPEPPAAH